MRISGGKFKGTKIGVARHVRPTSSFNRKRIFDILSSVEGYDVLDLFSGSGALGIEALSRGARSCVFVENSGKSLRILESNLRKLSLWDNVEVVKADVLSFLKTHAGKFDLILADPPYGWEAKEELLRAVSSHLREGGIFVLEMSSRERPPEVEGLRMYKLVRGGDTSIVFYRKEESHVQ